MTVPALVLLGGEQPPTVRDSVTSVAAALPNAVLTVLEGQQHMAMDTAPELLVARLLDFFGCVTRPRGNSSVTVPLTSPDAGRTLRPWGARASACSAR